MVCSFVTPYVRLRRQHDTRAKHQQAILGFVGILLGGVVGILSFLRYKAVKRSVFLESLLTSLCSSLVVVGWHHIVSHRILIHCQQATRVQLITSLTSSATMKKQYFWNGLIVSMGMVSLHVAAFAPSIRYTRVVTQSAPTGFLSSDVQQLGRIHQHHSTAEGKRNLCRPLKMMANPGLAFAAVTGAFTGGLFAGGLHAIAGTDHAV